MKETVILGLSGGVDSAVCAHLLQRRGFQVVGVFLSYQNADPADAQATAKRLGIDFECLDITQALQQHVIAPFIQGYLQGITPIPCILCNPAVKFRLLFDAAARHGARYVSTGHYARLLPAGDSAQGLYRSPSPNDQSYMLYRLPPEWIDRLIFPLQDYGDKAQIRALAEEQGIPVARKPDSMEICFLQGEYGDYIERHAPPPPPGDFVDQAGAKLGRHRGLHRYTVGQRRGLGVAGESRLYVSRLDVEKNQVVLTDTNPMRTGLTAGQVVFTAPSYRERRQFTCQCRIRHGKIEYPAQVTQLDGGRASVEFDGLARAPSPGQSAVFYDKAGRVLGGGFIEREEPGA